MISKQRKGASIKDLQKKQEKNFLNEILTNKKPTEEDDSSSQEDIESSASGTSTTISKKEKIKKFATRKDIKATKKTESFSDITRKKRVDCLFLVRGKDKNRAAWHYVLVDKHKKQMFLAKIKTGSVNVEEYGQILHSGWGQDPPEDIVKKIKEEFNIS